MAERWKGNQYHLFNKNCNHFADAFSLTLCGRGLPAWINRGANTIGSIPFINKIIPQEYLSPRIPKKTKVIGAKGKNGKSKEAAKGKEAPKSVTKGKVESAKTAFKNVNSKSISTSKCSLSGSKMKSEDVAQIKESIKEFLKTEAKETNLETDEEGSEENEEEEQI